MKTLLILFISLLTGFDIPYIPCKVTLGIDLPFDVTLKLSCHL